MGCKKRKHFDKTVYLSWKLFSKRLMDVRRNFFDLPFSSNLADIYFFKSVFFLFLQQKYFFLEYIGMNGPTPLTTKVRKMYTILRTMFTKWLIIIIFLKSALSSMVQSQIRSQLMIEENLLQAKIWGNMMKLYYMYCNTCAYYLDLY